jgi:hypothetical protein
MDGARMKTGKLNALQSLTRASAEAEVKEIQKSEDE